MRIIEYLEKQSKIFLTIFGLVIVLLIGFFDYVTGKEISFSIFYLFPVAFVTWLAGKKTGIYMAVISTIVWFVADIAAGHTYSNPFIPYWNATVRFGVFLSVCLLLSRLKTALDREKNISRIILHDLKNPLISILGFGNRLRGGRGRIDTDLRIIIESAQNMQRIVNDLLDFEKPFHADLKEEDIRNVINCAVNTCKIEAEKRGVMLAIELPSNPVEILVDSFYLERALINLINNAMEASTKGQKVIISTMPDKKCVVIKIKDYGSGMDGGTIKNIFTPFYTKNKNGTGLGLPIAKKIIEGHHGKIKIESKPETGTEVTIEMPNIDNRSHARVRTAKRVLSVKDNK